MSDSVAASGEFSGGSGAVTNLDAATLDFLNETAEVRSLRISERFGSAMSLSTNDFVQYLGIDLLNEPELVWVAREMCCAPMPPNAEMIVSKSRIVYFHDLENDYYTLEHPLTQRFLKVLEKQRLDILVLRTKPSINKLVLRIPDLVYQNFFKSTLQLPCQSCGIIQSVVRCDQCVMSYCQLCFDLLHFGLDGTVQGPRKFHTTTATAVGSLCSSCNKKKPQVYCGNCEDYFCFLCFEDMHRKGYRTDHKASLVRVSDAEIVEPARRCEECKDAPACFRCDTCMDEFCVSCFWKCHLNGNRRQHTVSKVNLNPLCNQCSNVRATIFCEQCQELLCSDCFTFLHSKGNRQVHLFQDASNFLLLVERTDPAFTEHARRARPKILWAITRLQGWTRGLAARQQFRKRKELVTKIQRKWRGALTRKKLLSMMDHFKWRKRQINHFILPKTRHERHVLRQKFASQVARREFAAKDSVSALQELKRTILATSVANPLEDPTRTEQNINKPPLPREEGADAAAAATLAGIISYPSPKELFLQEEIARRDKIGKPRADIRKARDLPLRELLRIDEALDEELVRKAEFDEIRRTSKSQSQSQSQLNLAPLKPQPPPLVLSAKNSSTNSSKP